MTTAPATVAADLRGRVLRGLGWKAASRIIVEVSRVGVAVLLARLLAPHDYGLAGMVLVFSAFVAVFSDVALGAALVQRRVLEERHRSTVFWTSVTAGAAFTLLGIAVSGPVARFYGEPAVQPLLAALSLSFLVTSLGATQSALLTRELDFRALEVRTMAATVAGATVGLAAALEGLGAWAIILQQLVIATVSTALLWRASGWRPRLAFSASALRELGGFSANVFGQRLLYYLHRNIDKLLLGRLLGASALGTYALATNVIQVPFSRLAGSVQEVLFPAFAKLQEDRERMAEVWLRTERLIGAVSIPALLALVAVAPDFVDVVLGERWRAAVPVIQLLAFAGLIQSLQTLTGDILQALDRTGILLGFTILFFAAHLAAFLVGIRFGLVGVAAGYAATTFLVEPIFTALTARALGMPLRQLYGALTGVCQAALVMLVGVVLARLALVDAGLPAGPRLLVLIGVGVAVYAPFCAWRAPEVLGELRRLRA